LFLFTGFRYNLGFSGSYYRTGGYYENQGDDELVALRELTQQFLSINQTVKIAVDFLPPNAPQKHPH
jgi:hypothetical protein